MTRVRLPTGLHVPEGVYDDGDGRLLAEDWTELRDMPGVELECRSHPDQWWPTAGKAIAFGDLRNWRCPNCAWAFRQGLAGTGGTPRF
jgi:hypothetical protein